MLGNAKAVRQSAPRLRTIQDCLKDLPATLRQAGRAANRLRRGRRLLVVMIGGGTARGKPVFDMRRRDFVALLGGAVSVWPIMARAQQAAMPVIGLLGSASPDFMADRLRAFRQGLERNRI